MNPKKISTAKLKNPDFKPVEIERFRGETGKTVFVEGIGDLIGQGRLLGKMNTRYLSLKGDWRYKNPKTGLIHAIINKVTRYKCNNKRNRNEMLFNNL